MATHNGNRRDKRAQGARAHAVIQGLEDQQGRKLNAGQKRRIIAAAGSAPYPPRRGTPKKWARRVIAARNANN